MQLADSALQTDEGIMAIALEIYVEQIQELCAACGTDEPTELILRANELAAMWRSGNHKMVEA